MKTKNIAIVLSFGLLAWLFIDSFTHLDFVASKNEALTRMKKTEVDHQQSIDSVKNIAKANFDLIRKNHKAESELASKRIKIIIALIILQFVVLFFTTKSKKV